MFAVTRVTPLSAYDFGEEDKEGPSMIRESALMLPNSPEQRQLETAPMPLSKFIPNPFDTSQSSLLLNRP